MVNRGLSLSIINVLLILIFMSLIIFPIGFWSYYNFEKTTQRTYEDKFVQVKTIAEILLEQESIILKDKTEELANIFSFKNDSILIEDSIDEYLLDEFDLVYFRKNDEIKDFSTSLYNTTELIEKTKDINVGKVYLKDIIYDDSRYLLMIYGKKIIDKKLSKVQGTLYIGNIINGNLSFINKIKQKAGLKDIVLLVDNNVIVSSSDKEYKNKLSKGEYGVLKSDDFIFSRDRLQINSSDLNVNILGVVENKIFINIKNDVKEQILVLFLIILAIGISSFYVVNKIIIKPLEKLLDFASKIKDDKNAKYDRTFIKEFNNISIGLRGIIGNLRDIEERFRLAINGTKDGLWDYDISKNTVFYSKNYEEMLGFNENELDNSYDNWLNRIHPAFYEKAVEDIKKHLNKESELYEEEYKVKCKDGSYIWVKVRGKALFNENGVAYRMVGFYTNINKIKKLELDNKKQEHMLLEQSKMVSMGELISNIAHQWRQPLNMISTIATGTKVKIEFGLFDEKEVINDLDKLNDSAQYLSKTINSLNDFSKKDIKKQEFNLAYVIDEVLDGTQIKLSTIEVENKIAQDITIKTYKNEFIQVITTIISNAKDALVKTQKEKAFLIECIELENTIIINFIDSGDGIDDKIKNKVFEPYFTTKHQSQGVGLGLYMTREIVNRQLQGKIEFSSSEFKVEDKVYDGTKFTLTLKSE